MTTILTIPVLLRRAAVWVGAALLGAVALYAQETPPLVADRVVVREGVGSFGQPALTVTGTINNQSTDSAFTDLLIDVLAYADDDTLIAEGFGILTNACGAGLLPTFAIQPERHQPFTAPLEIFEQGAAIDRIEVQFEARSVEPLAAPALDDAVTFVRDGEIVAVEWIDNDSFRFAEGCGRDVFTTWDWYVHDQRRGRTTQSLHPQAAQVDETLRERLGLGDPDLFAVSSLRFSPVGERLIYQRTLNDLYSASFVGAFPRLIQNRLYNYTLQSFYWLGGGTDHFSATYFGGYGDDVLYLTASASGRLISPTHLQNPPSLTLPGFSADGRRAIVGVDDATAGEGYALRVLTNNFFEFLIAADIPGNNYPAPLVLVDPDTVLNNLLPAVNGFYAAIDDAEGAKLVCFSRAQGTLTDLARLPLELGEDERAAWWLSPDGDQIALAATGARGGVWHIDLTRLPPCPNES